MNDENVVKGGHYDWSITNPQMVGEHSKTKHNVYREYLKQYLRERVKSPQFDKIRINIVDGFAGGGIYATGSYKDIYYGSPIILLQTLAEMQIELQAQQRKDFLLDYQLHLVDVSSEAIDTLRKVLKYRGFSELIGTRVFLHLDSFQNALPNLIDHVSGRGRTIFILDQYGYTDVPFSSLDLIFRSLNSPEVILTFAFHHLAAFVHDFDALNKTFARLCIGGLDRDEYNASITKRGGLEFLIQRHLHKAFLSVAKFFTPFFITSRGDESSGLRGSNLAYWLLHLSQHPLARDVMTRLHWDHHNHFAHYGGAGSNMLLGFDPAQTQSQNELQAFLFDDDARTRTKVALMADLPREIAHYRDGLTFADFHTNICNGSPADTEIMKEVLANLAQDRIINIKTAAGSRKRNPANILPDDRLFLPEQKAFMLPTQGLPIIRPKSSR